MNVSEGKFFEAIVPADGGNTTPIYSDSISLADHDGKATFQIVFAAGDTRIGADVKYLDEVYCRTKHIGFKVSREIKVGDCKGSIEIQFKGENGSPERKAKGIILRTT